ncbi:olfactory receptor 1M1-like [Gastrophryne carolinensis]
MARMTAQQPNAGLLPSKEIRHSVVAYGLGLQRAAHHCDSDASHYTAYLRLLAGSDGEISICFQQFYISHIELLTMPLRSSFPVLVDVERMDEENVTSITTVLLLGFQLPQNLSVLVFCTLLLISVVTICGNLLIITVVFYSQSLHCPMFFFLSQLSVLDILVVMDVLPNMLYIVLANEAVISFSACLTQLYFFILSESLEISLLTAMSYDRYLAICKPLHYTVIMSHQVCWRTVIACWIFGIVIVLNDVIAIFSLKFCGLNVIDHVFCDLEPVLELSCTDNTIAHLEIKMLASVIVVIPFGVLIASYVYIIVTIFDIPSVTGRKKVFSTCSSHLTVVGIFYGTIICVYLVPRRGELPHNAKFLSMLYTVVTPLMNPIIYSLRNKDLKNAIGKLITY